MPRKGTGHRQSLGSQRLTFSPFPRSMAMARRNGFSNHNKDKTEYSDSSDSEEFEGAVQADFVFFDPKPNDFHGVKFLLQIYLDTKEWDLSGFVDIILGQPTVGTVVKIENDEDDGVYSIVNALNLGTYKDKKCILEHKDYLLKLCLDGDVRNKLRSLHVVNLPPQLLPPLYGALFDEIDWATEDEPTEELQNSFCFKFYLIISKIYKHKNASQNKGKMKIGDEAVIFVKTEDVIFLELSSWSFNFPLHAQQVTTNEAGTYLLMGLVMAVEARKVPIFRKQLHVLTDE
ncbi:Isoamyl acetate-hydrolyzing esterase [Handroanthus impetiginosus]|uniref:Isoamyl acetate-hydrolyzing esterase n=1 Tax=Handroanthus impetiginosus TaxID=429701 RepID=A0A2G9HQV8_9LAMI|nr:Isoamyl acetate-hydrolyzing esterase [Handroanthus impetiginosus]